MVYKIKSVPEDFVVKEIIGLKFEDSGFSYYNLKKTNLSVQEAAEIISKKLRINKKFINYAGTKDKIAITEQKISIKNGPERNFDFGNLKLEFLGKGKERINLGDNLGNYFEIVVRDIDKKPEKIKSFVNYFDDQRFSDKNVEIGKAIIKRDFKKAADFILEDKKYGEMTKEYLEKNKNDFIGALRLIDRKILRMFVHAYQSYLWNLCVSENFERQKHNEIEYSLGKLNIPVEEDENPGFPIIGFGTEEDGTVEEILAREKITRRDFIIKEIPELSSEGSERNVFAEIKNLNISELENDELNNGKKKVKISFELGKGSYATMAIKQLFFS